MPTVCWIYAGAIDVHVDYKITNIATGKDDRIGGIFEPYCMEFKNHAIKLTAPWIA